MAMQIMAGQLNGDIIVYEDTCSQINLTDTLKDICDSYFKEETVQEEGEEITISICRYESIKALSKQIETEITLLLNKLNNTKGSDAKCELTSNVKDYVLLRSIIIEALLMDDSKHSVLTIS